MSAKYRLLMALATLFFTSTVNAGLIVNSIYLTIVETDFDSRNLSSLLPNDIALGMSLGGGFLPASANPDTLICQTSLEVFENVSSQDTCGGPQRNTGTLFVINGTATAATELQLGLDWGRGGFTLLAFSGLAPEIERYTSSIWWHKDWDNSAVLDILIPRAGDFLFLGLGFERCCDGINSARWRSLGLGSGLRKQGEPDDWNTLAVTVPEPGMLALMGLGLCGMMGMRKSRLRVGGEFAIPRLSFPDQMSTAYPGHHKIRAHRRQ